MRMDKSLWFLACVLCSVFCVLFSIASFAMPDSLTLEQSINIALSKNPQVLAAKERLKAAKARLSQAQGGLLPRVSLDSTYGKVYQQPMTISVSGTTFTTAPDEAADVTTYSFSLRQPVFMGGKLVYGIRVANAAYESAEQDFRKVQNDLIYNVIVSYYEFLKAQKMLSVVNSSMDSLNKHLRQVKIFYNSGIITQADVLRTETELANMKNIQLQVQNSELLAKFSFNTLLRNNLSENLILSSEVYPSTALDISYETLLSYAYKYRPEWLSFEYGKQIAQDSIGLAYGDYFPNIFLVGATGRTLTNYSSISTIYDLGSWRMMLAGSLNLFDGFYTANKVAEAKAVAQSVIEQEQSLKDAIALEVKSVHLNLLFAKDRFDAAKSAQDLARKGLRYAELNYSSNIGTNIAVLDAESAYLQSQSNFWNAVYDIEIAKAKIGKAVGLYSFFKTVL